MRSVVVSNGKYETLMGVRVSHLQSVSMNQLQDSQQICFLLLEEQLMLDVYNSEQVIAVEDLVVLKNVQ